MKPIRTPICDEVQVPANGDEPTVSPLPSWRQRTQDDRVQIGSVWQPTDEERAAIARGANVVLLVFAVRTPPVWLGIGEGEMFQPTVAADVAAPAPGVERLGVVELVEQA